MVANAKSKYKLDTPIFDLRAQKTSFSGTVYKDSVFIFFLAITFISLCVICIFLQLQYYNWGLEYNNYY